MRAIAFKSILSTAALVASAGISMNTAADHVGVSAAEDAYLPVRTVRFDYSELSTTEGRAAVERRIRLAAKIVCGTMDHGIAKNLTLHAIARNEVCYERTVDEALAQLGADRFASVE